MPGQRVCGRHRGFTLFELLLCTVLVGIAAGAAIAAVGPIQTFALDVAEAKLVQALRYARQEAVRRNTPVFVGFHAATRTVRVYRMDTSVIPAQEVLIRHPLEKGPYQFSLDPPALGAAAITFRAMFRFEDGDARPMIGFSGEGKPGKFPPGASPSYLLEPGYWRGFWQRGGVSYSKDDWVVQGGVAYNSLTNHTSGALFENDLASGQWAVRSQPAQITVAVGAHARDIHVAPFTGFVRVRQK